MTDIQQMIETAFREEFPHLGETDVPIHLDIAAAGKINIEVGIPAEFRWKSLEKRIQSELKHAGVSAKLRLTQTIPTAPAINSGKQIQGVKNIIAVASGKGGVGKSTTSVNIALALAYEGARVGVLDADIYGPSQTHMLGLEGQRPDSKGGNRIIPLKAFGVQCISMGNLVTEATPMVWRGPMVSGAFQQLLNAAAWDDLDYLVVDMPPGTGDIQLTLSQSVPVTGAVIVTTPQDIALLDARKGIEMFNKVDVPNLGVVENMATHTCSNCGHTESIFGEEGGRKLAEEYNVSLLGQLPLQLDIRKQTDEGRPPVAADPASEVSQVYRSIALQLATSIWQLAQQPNSVPTIEITDD